MKVIAHKDGTMEADVFSDVDITLFRKLVGFEDFKTVRNPVIVRDMESVAPVENKLISHLKKISVPVNVQKEKEPEKLPVVDLSRLPKVFMSKHLYAQVFGKAPHDISAGRPEKYRVILDLIDALVDQKKIKRVGKKSKHYMNLSFGNSEVSEFVESVERPMMELEKSPQLARLPERQTAKIAQPASLPEYPPKRYISGVLHSYDVKNAVIRMPNSFNMREIFKETYGYDFNAVRGDEETIKRYMKLFTTLRAMVKKEGSLISKKQFVNGRWIAYFYKNDGSQRQSASDDEGAPKELGFDYTDFPVIVPNLIKDVLETNDAITASTFTGLQSKNGNIIDEHSSNFLFDWICSNLSLVNKLTGKTFLYGGSGSSKFLKVDV